MRTIAVIAFGLGCTSEVQDDEPTPTGDSTPMDAGPVTCMDVTRANCIEIEGGDVATLQDTVNTLEDDTAVVLGSGTYSFDNALTLRGANSITLIGQGIDETILDFAKVPAQANGVDAIADDIVLEGFTVVDAKKDGIRVEDSDGVVLRAVKATWSAGPVETNGAYGIYPVRVRNVLMEDCEAYNASDAGIYVGQCINAIVRNNIAKANVAGIEIENTQFADVYGNLAEDNTAGLVVFDLPGNPIVGRDVRVHDNEIINNNRDNFAPGGTVASIPAGTGTFALASRLVEIDSNRYENNQTVDIALLSGLAISPNTEQWHIATEEIEGNVEDLGLVSDDAGVFNYRTERIYIHDNTHSGSGTDPDDLDSKTRLLGFLMGLVYGSKPVDTIVYDAIGESSFSPTDPSMNSNDNQICIGVVEGLSVVSLNLPNLEGAPLFSNLYRPEAPFAPFDCKGERPTPPPEL